METVEEFMGQYFLAREGEAQREEEARLPFRRRFFAEDCLWDSRRIEAADGEKLLEILAVTEGFEVVTTGVRSVLPNRRLKYYVQAQRGRWLIKAVHSECSLCNASNRGGIAGVCPLCGGTGWCDAEALLKRITLPGGSRRGGS